MGAKILALDIDGTLTNSRKEISPATKAALMHMMELGHKVVLASGRPVTGLRRYAGELELEKYGGYLLAFNGGCMIECKTGRILYKKVLTPEILPILYEFAADKGCGLATHHGDTAYSAFPPDRYVALEAGMNGMSLEQPPDFLGTVNFDMYKCFMTGEPERAAVLEPELRNLCRDKADVYRSDPFFIEIMPLHVDKGISLGRLLEITGAKREDLVCCGDGYNDIPMIKQAGVGVAMGNAQPEVKAAADFVTGSNDEDGLVRVVEEFILG